MKRRYDATKRCYRVTIKAEGHDPVTVEVQAADTWKARTVAMMQPETPTLRGERVTFDVTALGPCSLDRHAEISGAMPRL